MKSKRLTMGLSAVALCAALGGIYQGAALAGSKSSQVDDNAAAADIAKARKALAARRDRCCAPASRFPLPGMLAITERGRTPDPGSRVPGPVCPSSI